MSFLGDELLARIEGHLARLVEILEPKPVPDPVVRVSAAIDAEGLLTPAEREARVEEMRSRMATAARGGDFR